MTNDRHGLLSLDTLGALVLALAWISPLLFALWAAFHSPSAAVSFDLSAPWTLANFRAVWERAPWLTYLLTVGIFGFEGMCRRGHGSNTRWDLQSCPPPCPA